MRRLVAMVIVAVGAAACGSEVPDEATAATPTSAQAATVQVTTEGGPSSSVATTTIEVTTEPATSAAAPSTAPAAIGPATTLDPGLAADAAAIAESAGVPIDAAMLWLRLDTDLDPLQDELARTLGERHVGTWVDRDGQDVTINVGHLPGDREIVADVVGASTLAEWVELVERPFSADQLRAEAARLRDLANGPLETGIRASEGAVVLYVGSEAALDELFEPGELSPENRTGLPAIILEAASGAEG